MLFYIYNLVIPLAIPSFIIIIIGIQFDPNWQFIGLMLATQFYLFNMVILSTNIGLLNSQKNKNKPFVQENAGLSICFVLLNLPLLVVSLIANFSDNINWLLTTFLIAFSLILVYITILLISRNDLVSFAKKQKSLTTLAKNRERTSDNLIKKIKKGK